MQILRKLMGTTMKIPLERVYSSRDTGRSGSSNPLDSRYQGCTLGVTKAITLARTIERADRRPVDRNVDRNSNQPEFHVPRGISNTLPVIFP